MCEFRGANDSVTDRIYSQGQNIGNTSYYYTRDHLGSVRELAKSGGSTLGARYDYDPYGRSTTVLGTTPTDVNFTGLYRHSKSNLDLAFTAPAILISAGGSVAIPLRNRVDWICMATC